MTIPTLTPLMAGAAGAELEDWGPFEQATGAPTATFGREIWDIHDTVRKVYAIF